MRPTQKAAGDDSGGPNDSVGRTNTNTIPRPYDIAEGLRRRFADARRLPVLDCGCADPLSRRHLEDSCRWRVSV